jgi:beta-mannosidase
VTTPHPAPSWAIPDDVVEVDRIPTPTPGSTVPLDGAVWACKGYLDEEWMLRRATDPDSRDIHGWLPATVPGSVLDDVVRAGQAPDPMIDLGSRACEWVPARTWVYRREVELDAVDGPVRLEFDGIDHAARVFVNGTEVGGHRGAFVPVRWEVTEAIRPGRNVVAVVLERAPDLPSHFGRTETASEAKSRMSYGWDFCPRLPHLGIWRSARLRFPPPVAIEDLWVRSDGEPGTAARLSWRLELEARQAATVRLWVALEHAPDGGPEPVGGEERTLELGAGKHEVRGEIEVPDPRWWWPNGCGDQPRYCLRARVGAQGREDVREVVTALRSVEFVANADAPADARGYTVVVNGCRLYLQGWNWVPTSVHHGVPDPQRLEHHLGLAVRAGANLLRVWGGGPIESSDFYDGCDRLGLLVWQEFPLSSSLLGSVPPREPATVERFVAAAAGIVRSRRSHPSLALWCGGNELEDPAGTPAGDGDPLLDALHRVVIELDPDRAWLPTSPTGRVKTCTLTSIGTDPDGLHDVHGPWEHQGLTGQRNLYDRSTSLLHSEFGVEGMANLETIEAFVSEGNRWPADRSNPHVVHRGDFWVNAELLHEVFGPLDDPARLVDASQLLQADGLRYAIEANRRRQWRQSGSIPWQLGEPFPNVFCTSVVDHAGRPKAAYYAVAEAYADLLVSARTETQAWADHTSVDAELWLGQHGDRLRRARVEATLIDHRGRGLGETSVFEAEPAAGGSTRIADVRWPLPPAEVPLFWLALTLRDDAGRPRATNRYLLARAGDLRAATGLPPCQLVVRRSAAEGSLTVRNVGDHVAMGVRAHDARPPRAPGYVWFDTGHLTLLPGESRKIRVGWIGTGASPPLAVGAWNTDRIVVD